MKWFRMIIVSLGILMLGIPQLCVAEEEIEKTEKEVFSVGEIRVTAHREVNIELNPSSTVINVKKYKKPSPVRNVVDILKDSALVDFRGKSDIDVASERGGSPILLRGFDVRRFVNALDGVSFDQPLHFGQVIDYASIPIGQVEKIEILPGAHSARYWSKSIGGVINVKTKEPKRRKDTKPDVEFKSSYGSYGTVNNCAVVEGGYNAFNYALSAHNCSTDGFLRHGASEMNNYALMLGYVFPSEGYVKYMGAYVDTDRESYASNDPAGDYDSDYPVVTADTSGAGDIAEDSQTHIETWTHHLSYVQPTPIGKFTLGASYTTKPNHYFTKIKNGQFVENPNSEGEQLAILLQDEIELFDGNTLIAGFDSIDFWTKFKPRSDDHNRLRNHKSGFIEDVWQITPRLQVRAGLRYENVRLNINNYSETAGWGSRQGYQVTFDSPKKYIEKDWDKFLPKSFITYELDDLWEPLRETSISVGASKVWNVAPYCLV